jgi:hypothetical protein
LILAVTASLLSIRSPYAFAFEPPANTQTTSPMTFLGVPYRLASFNQKANPMWEFTAPNQTISNWTTLLTVVDRPDARTRPDLDRLSQGVLDNYKSHNGKVLLAKTMVDASGTPFNYMVVGFDQPNDHRYELDFVKTALGQKNAYMMVYGVRVADAHDYVAKAKIYLDQHSSEIGRELEKIAAPPTSTLARKEF